MSKKIVVAGAGHGGVIAAAKLAKEGFDVTVYEKKKRENIGHDWEDRFDFQTVLDAVEKDEMPDGAWKYRGNTVFVSPSMSAPKSKSTLHPTNAKKSCGENRL